MRGSYPVTNNISCLSAVLGNQRPHREKYFIMGAVAKQKLEFKLGKDVPQFKGRSLYTKRRENVVERKNISNLLSDDR